MSEDIKQAMDETRDTKADPSKAVVEGRVRVDSDLLDTDLSGYEYFWQGEPFTGTALELDKAGTGEIISETDYKDGIQSGFYREWYSYPDQLKMEKHYFYNTRDGLQREWYPNGQLKEEVKVKLGTTLRCTEWDEDGVQIKNGVNE